MTQLTLYETAFASESEWLSVLKDLGLIQVTLQSDEYITDDEIPETVELTITDIKKN